MKCSFQRSGLIQGFEQLQSRRARGAWRRNGRRLGTEWRERFPGARAAWRSGSFGASRARPGGGIGFRQAEAKAFERAPRGRSASSGRPRSATFQAATGGAPGQWARAAARGATAAARQALAAMAGSLEGAAQGRERFGRRSMSARCCNCCSRRWRMVPAVPRPTASSFGPIGGPPAPSQQGFRRG